MTSNLYRHTFFLDKDIDYLKNVEIIEYDIQSGGYNVIKYFNLLPKKDINYLSKLDKKMRQIQIGLYQKGDKEFAKRLEEGFRECRRMFFEANDLQDDNIVSIKRDAIFVVNKPIKNYKFKNIIFKEKNTYSSYYYMNKMEFYYSSNTDILDVKGISDLSNHTEFINLLKKIFRVVEKQEYKTYVKYILKYTREYKQKILDIECYRELNTEGLYRYNMESNDNFKRRYDIGLDYIDKANINKLDITFNYMRYLIPLVQNLI